jgi:DNA-binding winged helix-turn-helix (wHTH) protein
MKYAVHDATVDFERKRLSRGEVEIEMEPRVAEVLSYLVENAGRVVSREELLNAVWRTLNVSDDVLTRCVNLIRKAFDDDPASPRVLETITKRGYRLIANVRPIDENASAKTALLQPRFEAGLLSGRISLTLLEMAEAQSRIGGAAFAALSIPSAAITEGNSLRASSRGRQVLAHVVERDLVVEISRQAFALCAPIVGAILGFALAILFLIGSQIGQPNRVGIDLAAALVGAGLGLAVRSHAARALERRLREDLSILLTAARVR